uniref:Cytochrome P450 n=1 Tax=Panagrellus redivivus TaxID=6233 RepID=A0A7E4V9Y7_PANRE
MLTEYVFTLIVLLICFYNFYWKRRGLPPGPIPFPLIGNIHQISQPQYNVWTRKYGPIYTYWMGEMAIVSVNDVAVIHDAFVKNGDDYAGRAQIHELLEIVKHGDHGIIFSEGQLWRGQRRFTLQVFRNFGFGKNIMQEQILDEFVDLKVEVADAAKQGAMVDMKGVIDLAVANIINNLLFGFRYKGERRHEFEDDKKLIMEVVTHFGSLFGMIFMHKAHIFKHVPILSSAYAKMVDDRDRLKDQLYGCHFDLWSAGQETTSTTLGWACIYLIKNPEAQQKLQAELDHVIGSDRLIRCEDKPQLNYLNAIVAETQRLSNIVPQNLLHRTLADVEIAGYKLPKHTVITHMISSVMYDERYFPDPMAFKPERFLTPDGNYISSPALMPFGVGKRACLGESMAKMELFLILANTFNHFSLSEDKHHPISTFRTVGGTVPPPDFKCRVQLRLEKNNKLANTIQ